MTIVVDCLLILLGDRTGGKEAGVEIRDITRYCC
jgi:hypothetical protein